LLIAVLARATEDVLTQPWASDRRHKKRDDEPLHLMFTLLVLSPCLVVLQTATTRKLAQSTAAGAQKASQAKFKARSAFGPQHTPPALEPDVQTLLFFCFQPCSILDSHQI
jgi:hypothetical protein